MAGYTPVFDSVYHGTLCGRWPTLPVWLTLLPMADKDGYIDLTPQAISALTGWPLDLLRKAIDELMQPDPDSRSPQESGRRLVLIDPENRSWGWRVVNHALYRERSRLKAKSEREVSDGSNARRLADRRGPPATAADRPSPPVTPSQTQTQTQTLREEGSSNPVPLKRDDGPVDRVFTHWQAEHRKPRAKLDPKRRRVIEAALKAFDEATVCEAISGYRLSPHHMGENERRTVYDDIELFLRDVKHIEAGLAFARGPPAPARSAVELAVQRLRVNGHGSERVVSEQGQPGESCVGALVRVLR